MAKFLKQRLFCVGLDGEFFWRLSVLGSAPEFYRSGESKISETGDWPVPYSQDTDVILLIYNEK